MNRFTNAGSMKVKNQGGGSCNTVVRAFPGAAIFLPWSRTSDVMRRVRTERPFETLAMVVMPDHLHWIWRLPPADADFSIRWQLIKQHMTHRLAGRIGVRTLWQPRFWEYTLRDGADLETHTHCIHFNPVKHGLVQQVAQWPHSTFHRFVKNGVYPPDWGVGVEGLSRVPE